MAPRSLALKLPGIQFVFLLARISCLSCLPTQDLTALAEESFNGSDEVAHDWVPNLNLLQVRTQRISRPSVLGELPDLAEAPDAGSVQQPLVSPASVAACCGGCSATADGPDTAVGRLAAKLQGSPLLLQLGQEEEKPPKTIFLNSKYSGHLADGRLECPAARCDVTKNIAAADSADAVVWNARWMDPIEVPHPKPLGQLWVYNFFFEAPVYMGEDVNALETRLIEEAGDIDWTMTYSPRSDIFSPIGRLVPVDTSSDHASSMSLTSTTNYAAGRSHLLLWFVSNCDGPRLRFFQSLQDLLPPDQVHIYGECGEPSPCPGRDENDECHQKLFSKYKFYAAFENSRCGGYITEKFFRPFAEGMVPLVMGGLHRSDYEALAPKDSFLDVDDFGSLFDLASQLLIYDEDETAYNSLHNWRSAFRISNTLETTQHAFCELCQRLHGDPSIALVQANTSASDADAAQTSLSSWWYNGACRSEVPDW